MRSRHEERESSEGNKGNGWQIQPGKQPKGDSPRLSWISYSMLQGEHPAAFYLGPLP
jgi:hypothetical protein